METLERYCMILGVTPGSTAEEVKKAFRSKIKEVHPDRVRTEVQSDEARKIIEAYQALKDGVPLTIRPEQKRNRAHARPEPGEKTQYTDHTGKVRTKTHGRAGHVNFDQGRETGRRIFESIFDGGNPTSADWEQFQAFFSRYNRSHETSPFAENPFSTASTEYAPFDHPIDNGQVRYNRAEESLRETVRKYTRQQKTRPKKQWARDYIGQLTKTQVLFRDVANRHPSLTARSLGRVRQITELISALRTML